MLRSLALALCDVGAGVLALAGLIKFFDPTPWVTAIGALGIPLGPARSRRRARVLARAVGVVEVTVAVLVVVVGGAVVSGALALSYAAFVAVSLVATRRGGASCGCFGVRSAPISGLHVMLNAAVAITAGIGAIDGSESLVDRLDGGAGATLGYLTFLGLGIAAMVTAMTTGAELWALKRAVAPLPVRTGVR